VVDDEPLDDGDDVIDGPAVHGHLAHLSAVALRGLVDPTIARWTFMRGGTDQLWSTPLALLQNVLYLAHERS
jgi:hypothetical protein